jgi:hypothetical protein
VDKFNLFSESPGGRIDVGQATGSTEILMFIYDLAPGQSSSPYHYEYDEEWLLVVEGTVVDSAPAPLEVRQAIAIRYLGEEGGRAFVEGMGDTPSTLFTVRPDRWITADFAGDV